MKAHVNAYTHTHTHALQRTPTHANARNVRAKVWRVDLGRGGLTALACAFACVTARFTKIYESEETKEKEEENFLPSIS